jgi:hypothetical protein
MDEKDMYALLHMKKMIRIVKDKKYFDNYMKKLERMQKFRALSRMR